MRVSARNVTSHGCGLRVGTQDGIIVGCAGVRHRANCLAVQLWRHHALPDEPVERTSVLVIDASVDAGTKNVARRLVQGSRLIGIWEPGGVLRDSMGEFV